MVTKDMIRRIPKVELHDHLDGGLRVGTIIELAAKDGIELPSTSEAELREWFVRGCRQKSLPLYLETFTYTTAVMLYLETFTYTTAVMQSKENLERVAFEAMEDLAAENVVYAELRFAPDLHTKGGLNLEEVVTAVLAGLDRGREATGVQYVRQPVCNTASYCAPCATRTPQARWTSPSSRLRSRTAASWPST